MKLKNHQIESLASAIDRLKGRLEVVTVGEGKQVVVKPFSFAEGVRYACTRTLNSIKPALEALQADKDAARVECAPDSLNVKSDHPGAVKLQAAMTALAKEEREVVLHTVKLSALNVDKNQLDPDLVSDLWPMIEEEKAAEV